MFMSEHGHDLMESETGSSSAMPEEVLEQNALTSTL